MAENWYSRAYSYDYDGTSAYKIKEYDKYNEETQKKQEEKKQGRLKRAAVNHKKAFIITGVVFAVAIAFLYANVMLIRVCAKYDELTASLEDIKVRNTQTSFEIASGIDLAEVEEKAKTEFGMQQPESHQNVYVEVVQSDYAETTQQPVSEGNITDKMISGLKSFLEYIR